MVHDAFESGPDPITIVTRQPTTSIVEVGCGSCTSASAFELGLIEVHPAGAKDSGRIRGEQLGKAARGFFSGRDQKNQGIATAQAAAEAFHSAGDPTSEQGALSVLGAGYFQQYEYQKAEDSFRRALELAASEDPSLEADLLNNLAVCRKYVGDPDGAINYYSQARERWRAAPIRTIGESTTLTNLGVLLADLGDYKKALEHHLAATEILNAGSDQFLPAMAAHNLGATYMGLGDNSEAYRYIKQSIAGFRAVKNGTRELARALMNLSLVAIERGEYLDAKNFVSEALPLVKNDQRRTAEGLSNLCKIETLLGEPRDAERHCRDALRLVATSAETRQRAIALHNLGVALSGQRRWDEAVPSLEAALALRRSNKLTSGIIETLTRLAQAQAQRGNLDSASKLASEAVVEAESTRARVTAERLRTSYFAAKQSSYETWIEILMQMHSRNPGSGFDVKAFEVAERRRARTLIDVLGETRDSFATSQAGELVGRRTSLARQVNFLTSQRTKLEGKKGQEAESGRISVQIDEALRDLELLEAKLREDNPRLSTILSPTLPNLESIRRELAPTDVLLEYALCPTKSFGWVVTRQGFRSVELPSRMQLEKTAETVLSLSSKIKTRRRNFDLEEQYKTALTSLKAQVLGPFQEITLGQRLLIAPDGMLQLVPFAALVEARIESVQIPSAWVLVELRKGRRGDRYGQSLAIFADPVFDNQDPRAPLDGRHAEADGQPLARLPFSGREAMKIEAAAGSAHTRAFSGLDANRAAFLESCKRPNLFLHVATHALIDLDRPELSSIVLSQIDANGHPVDGHVYLHELYGLRLGAKIVTLSGCRTGDGKAMKGEGLLGLTRGFLFAGARSVMVTLWPVNDESTADLMAAFYGELLSKPETSPATALLAAQKKLQQSDRWQDPYYWAGFVLQGDWR